MKKVFIFFAVIIFFNISVYAKKSKKSNPNKFDFYLNQIRKNLDNPEAIIAYIDSLKHLKSQTNIVSQKKDFVPRYLLFEKDFTLDSSSVFIGRIFSIFTKINIKGTFDGLLINFADDIILDSTAEVYGDVVVFFGQIIDKRKNKSIIGNKIIINPFSLSLLQSGKTDYLNKIFINIVFIILILLVYRFNSRRINIVMDNITNHYIQCISVGFLFVIMFLPFVFILIISIIGIFFIPLLFILYIWATIIGLISLLGLFSNFFKTIFKINLSNYIFLVLLFLGFSFLNEITLFLYSITPIEYFIPSKFFLWINFLIRSIVFMVGIGGYVISYKDIIYYIFPKKDLKYE